MGCCHADFALLESSDAGFTLGMPTFTFGPGVLAEAGPNAQELALKRVALFTDTNLAKGEHVEKVKASLTTAGVDVVVYDQVRIEPDDASLQDAARFVGEAPMVAHNAEWTRFTRASVRTNAMGRCDPVRTTGFGRPRSP